MSHQHDPSEHFRELAAAFDTSKQMRELAAAFDTSKQMWELGAAFDTSKQMRELGAQLTRTAILGWTREVAGVATGAVNALTDLEAVLQEDPSAQEDPISPWLTDLPQLAQRRLFLLVLAALWAVLDVVNSFAGVTPPAHLDKLIIGLLAIATVLNETIGDPPSSG